MAATRYDLFFGSSNAGLAPTFSTYVNDATGVALTKPLISDLGGGFYRFSVDWATNGATVIRYAAGPLNGVEVSDTLTSNPAPGTVTPAQRVQNLALYPTAKTVLNRTAIQVGLAALDDPYASTDQAWVILRDLLTSVLDDLQQSGPEDGWTNTRQPCSFVTDGVSTSYMLPVDYHEMVDGTGWNLTARFPLVGPLSSQQGAMLQAQVVTIALNVAFQIRGGLLVFPIVPASGATVSFEYVSTYIVQSASAGVPDKDRPSANDDVILFGEELLIAGLRLRYDEHKGMDTMRAQQRFDEKLEGEIGRNDPGPVVSLGGPRRLNRMINGENIAGGNWPRT